MNRPALIAAGFAVGMVLMWLAMPVLYPPWENPDQPAFSDLRKFTAPPEGDEAAMERYAALQDKLSTQAETLIGDPLRIIVPEERRSPEWFLERGAATIREALLECHLVLHHELYARYVAALGEDEIDKTVLYGPNLKQRTSCANAYRADAAIKGITLDF